MENIKLSVLSNTLKDANAIGRTTFMSIADLLKLQDGYEDVSYENMTEESLNQAIGKIATKDVTGLVGAPLARLMSIAVILKLHLTDDEVFELHAIEQIAVQFKNIAKRGEWENDKLVVSALEVARKYGLEQNVLEVISIVRGKADVCAVLEDPPINNSSNNGNDGNNGSSDLVLPSTPKKAGTKELDPKDFDFSNL